MISDKSYDDRDGFIWMDGKMLSWREAKVHVLSHGLHYGSGVFEGERIYSGNVFKEREHSQRLIRSAELIDMDMPYTVEQIIEARQEMIEANNLKDGYIRPVAWRGSEEMGISAQSTKTHVAIAGWYWGAYFNEEKREKGIQMETAKWRTPMPDTAVTQSKACGLYTTHTMAKHSAERAGKDDALMIDYRGLVAEGTGANIFMVKDGAIKTPVPDCFLNGITRQTMMVLAKENGFKVEECQITPEELKSADEIFMTGTAAEVTAVGKIDDATFTVGPVVRQLRDAYADLVRTKAKAA